MKCDKCDNRAIEHIRYSGAHLCAEHFTEFFEERAKKEIRGIKGRVAVALSGGKDSTALLHFACDNIEEVIAITLDEGIKDYRDDSIKIAADNCRALGVEHVIVDLKKEIGFSIDDIFSLYEERGIKHAECSFCGVMRRYYINKVAKEMNVDYLLFAHNLDDMAQTALMNVTHNDLARGLPPYSGRVFVKRIAPFKWIPEREVAIYCFVKGINCHIGECPYAKVAERNRYRDAVNILEKGSPGARHGMVKSYDRISKLFRRGGEIKKCRKCGEPTSREICKRCEMVNKLQDLKNSPNFSFSEEV
ncbi:MAG: TIGR00269 family protein [Candidatus Thermoplasmatota archaeon]|nr:TIGR00269 family protein [Candidatus Thermoplasmatota archaeon]